tara:strand:+ start:54 stop:410 length:357 start_codon:yes stop_codon:yes gene_type:complete
MLKNKRFEDVDLTFFPFFMMPHKNTVTPLNEEYITDEDSNGTFLPDTIYNSFISSESIKATTIGNGETLVDYTSQKKTNNNPVVTDSKRFVIKDGATSPNTAKKRIKRKGKTKRRNSK